MPARPWPDEGSPGRGGPPGSGTRWRGAAARRLRELAERIDPARGQAFGGPATGVSFGSGSDSAGARPTAARGLEVRGLDVSGAPEHWAKLVRDAGLAAPLDSSPEPRAPGAALDAPAVAGHFAAVLHLGSRLRGEMARALPGLPWAKSPTTAAPGPGDGRLAPISTSSAGPRTPDSWASDTATPDSGDAVQHPTSPRLTLGRQMRRVPAPIPFPTPVPTEGPPVARPALRAPAPAKDVEQASQLVIASAPAKKPQKTAQATPPDAPVLRIRPRRAAENDSGLARAASSPALHPETPVARPALRASGLPGDVARASQRLPSNPLRPATTPPAPAPGGMTPQTASAVVVRSEAARPEQPRPQAHASTVQDRRLQDRTPAPPMAGIWPELAPRPTPGPQQTSPERLEGALARAARLTAERQAV